MRVVGYILDSMLDNIIVGFMTTAFYFLNINKIIFFNYFSYHSFFYYEVNFYNIKIF